MTSMWSRRTTPRIGFSLNFFFQAEDGIRDIGVTGVQTCALPIYAVVPERPDRVEDLVVPGRAGQRPAPGRGHHVGVHGRLVLEQELVVALGALDLLARSEERRVGKGVDLGGRRIIKKKQSEPSNV